ncbi:MAG: hypothetical protein JSV92_00565 [archaeon]|nr:MAG: hypothetical protein JSV92_00565 [archaeon]
MDKAIDIIHNTINTTHDSINTVLESIEELNGLRGEIKTRSWPTRIVECGYRKDGCEKICPYHQVGLDTLRKKLISEKTDTGKEYDRLLTNITIEPLSGEFSLKLQKHYSERDPPFDFCVIDFSAKEEGVFTYENQKTFEESAHKIGNSVVRKIRREYKKDKD